jgi:hypothetical protein
VLGHGECGALARHSWVTLICWEGWDQRTASPVQQLPCRPASCWLAVARGALTSLSIVPAGATRTHNIATATTACGPPPAAWCTSQSERHAEQLRSSLLRCDWCCSDCSCQSQAGMHPCRSVVSRFDFKGKFIHDLTLDVWAQENVSGGEPPSHCWRSAQRFCCMTPRPIYKGSPACFHS